MQSRAQWTAATAYALVVDVQAAKLKEYKGAVVGVGATILRDGLMAAIAELQRMKDRGGKTVLEHFAKMKVVENPGNDFGAAVRGLPVSEYMHASRRAIQASSWLLRAAQAKSTTGE